MIPGRNQGFGHFLEEVKSLGVEIERVRVKNKDLCTVCGGCAETMLESKTYAECGIQR